MSENLFASLLEEYLEPRATAGTIIRGQLAQPVLKKGRLQGYLVELQGKADGFLPVEELPEYPQAGDQLEAMVTKAEDDEGLVLLSLVGLRHARAWERVEQARSSQQMIKVQVVGVSTDRNQEEKGLLAEVFQLPAFMPRTHVGKQDLRSLVGTEITCQVIDVDEERDSIILSRRAWLKQQRVKQQKREQSESKRKAQKQVFRSLKAGQVLKGRVSKFQRFGAFVDIGEGLEALLHNANISWDPVKAADVLEVGQELAVKVLSVKGSPGKPQISLSIKDDKNPDWNKASLSLREGQWIDCEVSQIIPDLGLIVRPEGFSITGLVHHDRLPKGKSLEDFNPEESITACVRFISSERERLALSMKGGKR